MPFPRPFIVLLLALSCAHARSPEQRGSSPEFAQLVDEYFAARFAYAPSRATAVGFHELDASLEDLSRERIEEQIAGLKRFQARLSAFDRDRLSFDEAIDARLIGNSINAALLDLTVVRNWERNPMLYAGLPGSAIDSLMKRDFAPAPERRSNRAAPFSRRFETRPDLPPYQQRD